MEKKKIYLGVLLKEKNFVVCRRRMKGLILNAPFPMLKLIRPPTLFLRDFERNSVFSVFFFTHTYTAGKAPWVTASVKINYFIGDGGHVKIISFWQCSRGRRTRNSLGMRTNVWRCADLQAIIPIYWVSGNRWI